MLALLQKLFGLPSQSKTDPNRIAAGSQKDHQQTMQYTLNQLRDIEHKILRNLEHNPDPTKADPESFFSKN